MAPARTRSTSCSRRILPGLALLTLPIGCALWPTATASVERLVILHINDHHGQIQPVDFTVRPGVVERRGGFAALSRFIAQQRAQVAGETGAELWLTDGGDWFQGTPEGNEDCGWSVMACRNRLNFTAVTIGNHEYDYGEDNLIRIASRATHPVLAANIKTVGGEAARDYVRPYLVKELGGVRVALVGLITSDTKAVSTGPFGSARFVDEIETLKALMPELRECADAVVLITHCGVEKDREIARAFPSIAIILGGHSHTALPKGAKEGDTWIVQSRGRGTAVSRLEVTVDQRTRRLRVDDARLVPIRPPSIEVQDAARDFLAQTFAAIGPKWDQSVGEITGDPDLRARGTIGSTAGGNYVADLIRRIGEAEVGFTNKGGIRSRLAKGAITRRQVFQTLPFDNSVVAFEVKGVHLRTLLTMSLRPPRRPLEISGADYSFRLVDGRRRLVAINVGGKPLVDERRYRIATNSFLAQGGDGFDLLARLKPCFAGSAWLRDLMMRELRAVGSIDLNGEKRIRLVE